MKRSIGSIKFIIIHYTGMQSDRESIKRLCNPISKVSSHYLITRSGKIYQLVKNQKIAWHAGISCWGKYKNLNKNSIGIELVNKGHRLGYSSFKKKQIFSLIKICKNLKKKYKIKDKNILGHSDIAPTRKNDPGEKFPWEFLALNKIGVWHNYNHNLLKKLRRKKIFEKKDKKKFILNLKKLGYCFSKKEKNFYNKILKAFQRHYRRDLINGLLDQECFLISKRLVKTL